MAEWASRLTDKSSSTRTVPAELMKRDLRLMVDLVAEMAGPMRREARELWEKACEHYGRTAAARGLVAGEVTEEFSALREILTVDLAADVAALRGPPGPRGAASHQPGHRPRDRGGGRRVYRRAGGPALHQGRGSLRGE